MENKPVDNNNSQEQVQEPIFVSIPLPGSQERDSVLAKKSIHKDREGKPVYNVCYCHKVPPYPEQVHSKALNATTIEMRRTFCSTGCLRASIVDVDGKAMWQQNCEAILLQLPLSELPPAAPSKIIQ